MTGRNAIEDRTGTKLRYRNNGRHGDTADVPPMDDPRTLRRGSAVRKETLMLTKWKAKLQKAFAALKGWRPVFELHYEEESGLYPRGDADEGAVLRRSEGLLRTDLRKIGAILSVSGLLLYLRLRRH